MMFKKITFISFFCLSLFIGFGFFQARQFLNHPPSSDTNELLIEINEGSSFREVTQVLAKAGLITSEFSFRLLGKLTQQETKIKPGEYRLHRAMTPKVLLDTLVKGDILQYHVVIPEGKSLREIAEILEQAGLVKAEVFQQIGRDPKIIQALGFDGDSLEGFLFPETYRFTKQMPPDQIVLRIASQFKLVYDDTYKKQADIIGMTQMEVVTLASIIEKETAAPEERTIVSAVFHNRLKKRMRLQSDPTVIFSLENFNGNLTRKDLRHVSPYNTYRVRGLPPGPIASPGKEAIHAALYPADVDYLYFVSKKNGTHYFSLTLKEHNAAVRKFQLGKKGKNACPSCIRKAKG